MLGAVYFAVQLWAVFRSRCWSVVAASPPSLMVGVTAATCWQSCRWVMWWATFRGPPRVCVRPGWGGLRRGRRARGLIQKTKKLLKAHGYRMHERKKLHVRRGHQRFTPEHLLSVLIDDKEGLVARLFERMDVPMDAVVGQLKAELQKLVIGPSGKLRAPTLFKGKTVMVGFHEEGYDQLFG